MRLVYDIETDGLEATKIWVLVVKNIDTGNVFAYSDYDADLPDLIDGISVLSNAELLVGHNIISFDNRVVDKLYGTDLNSKRCHDTFVMSQVLRYKRKHRHGLAGWGEHLGNHKIDYDDWSQYSKEMLRYCKKDVHVNHDVYNALIEEYTKIHGKNPMIKEGLRIEHDTAVFNAQVRTVGWKFDLERAGETQRRMLQRMNEIEGTIEPQLGDRKIWIDKEDRTPKYKKNGEYTSATAKQLSEYYNKDITVSDTDAHPAGTPFRRYRMEPITLGSVDLVKDWLLTKGWVPDEYQKKKIGFEWVTMGPKLTTTSLKKMGKIGEMIDEYYTLRNRHSVVDGWIEKSIEGRLHGNMWTIGTPTFRCRHEVIVNLPQV